MYATLTVSHRLDVARPEVVRRLERVFGRNDPDALAASVIMRSSPESLVHYSVVNASFGLYCCVVSDREVMVVVEPRGMYSRQACKVVWAGVRRAFGGQRVRLDDATLVDVSSAEGVLHGRVGLGAQLRRASVYQPIVVGLATAPIVAAVLVVLALRGQSPPQTAYLAGGPGVVNALWFIGV